MSKQSTQKKGGLVKLTLGLMVIGGIIVAVLANVGSTTSATNNIATSTPEQVVETQSEGQLKRDQIRSRKDIRRQQELLVEETYLLEEKSKTQDEMAESIADLELQLSSTKASFGAQLESIETNLEEVRAEKIDFQ